MVESEKAADQASSGADDSLSPAEPAGLDERIAITMRLLPRLRTLSPTELRSLATHLRILSNIAEAWATRD